MRLWKLEIFESFNSQGSDNYRRYYVITDSREDAIKIVESQYLMIRDRMVTAGWTDDDGRWHPGENLIKELAHRPTFDNTILPI